MRFFCYPGCLLGALNHRISGPYHNSMFHAMKKKKTDIRAPSTNIQTDELWLGGDER